MAEPIPNQPSPLRSGASTPAHHVPFSRPSTPHAFPPQIGFYGLGAMGFEMASNLANHPYVHPSGTLPPLLVFNRTVSKSELLVKHVGADKAVVAPDVETFVKACDVIITSFASDDVVKSVYTEFGQILQSIKFPLPRPKIFVETSTIFPALAGELDHFISQKAHVHFLTCPVFGRPSAAKARGLVMIMAGDYRAKKEVAYLLVPALGKKVWDLGGNVEKAPTFKLIGNAFILGQIELMAETVTLAEKSGVGAENVMQFIKESLDESSLMKYAPKLLNDEFEGTHGFAIDGGIKDASHIRALTEAHNSPMPCIDIAHRSMLTARAVHLGKKTRGDPTFDVLDWSALIAGPRLAAGLNAFDKAKHAKVVKED